VKPSQEILSEQCEKCGASEMEMVVRKKWAPRIGYLLIYLVIAIIFFSLYGTFSSRYSSDNVMLFFVGLTPLVVAPLIIELRHKKIVMGQKCSQCNYFQSDKSINT